MFIFDASNIVSYNDFNEFLIKEKIFFDSEKTKLFNEYNILAPEKWNFDIEEYQKFRTDYRKLNRKILKDVISHYRHFLPSKCLIMEFGSFVKHTERILSDIDFTICYDEQKTKVYECAEELIDYTLATIFGFSIDHVHGNFQHYPDIPEFYRLTEANNQYRLQFDKVYIDYKCGPETLVENFINIKNVRDYNSLITNFRLKYEKNRNIDCLYSINILENSTEHDLIKDLRILEQKYDICKNYPFNLEDTILIRKISVSNLKHILKHDCIVQFYIFMAKLRKYVQFSNFYSMAIEMIWQNKSVQHLFGKDFTKKLEEAFVTFIFYWNRIEISLHHRNIALSTRCYKEFEIDEINNLLAEDWNDSTTIQTIISAKNNLMNLVAEGLSKL